jgi:hypothetical protein
MTMCAVLLLGVLWFITLSYRAFARMSMKIFVFFGIYWAFAG